jgi:hypothetical protein
LFSAAEGTLFVPDAGFAWLTFETTVTFSMDRMRRR